MPKTTRGIAPNAFRRPEPDEGRSASARSRALASQPHRRIGVARRIQLRRSGLVGLPALSLSKGTDLSSAVTRAVQKWPRSGSNRRRRCFVPGGHSASLSNRWLAVVRIAPADVATVSAAAEGSFFRGAKREDPFDRLRAGKPTGPVRRCTAAATVRHVRVDDSRGPAAVRSITMDLTKPSTSPKFLHVADGTSTTDTIREAGIPGATSIWADPLHEGPVPGQLSDAALLDVRARHLSSGAPDFAARVGEIAAEMQHWREVIADVASYDELVLWFEHDLFDYSTSSNYSAGCDKRCHRQRRSA